jgi:lysozyme
VSYRDIAKVQIKVDEGRRLKPYRCTAGKLSIGYGRNLDDEGISQEEADFLLTNDIEKAEATARALFPSFDKLSDARKAVLLNMSYNMGQTVLATFKKFRKAVLEEQWDEAARQMLLSTWAAQVGARATRLAKQMEVS